MQGAFRKAAMLALTLGISAPANIVWAEQFIKIDGIDGESLAIGLDRFPGDTFTPLQLRNFRSAGIATLGDLMEADPAVVGRVLDLSPEQARFMQRQIREASSAQRR